MLTIASFKWKPITGGYDLPMLIDSYTDKHVRIHKAMLERNLTIPFRYVCVTDEPVDGIECITLWDKCRHLGGCYNRLYTFSKDMKQVLGERFACIDLDVVILKNCDHIFDRPEPFICNSYKPSPDNPNPRDQYCNGGMYMMDAGVHDDLWTTFENDFDKQIDEIDKCRADNICIGSDQEWIRIHLCGKKKIEKGHKPFPLWTNDDGVYEWNQVRRNGLQDNACMVMFAGARDPSISRGDWVKEHWHE